MSLHFLVLLRQVFCDLNHLIRLPLVILFLITLVLRLLSLVLRALEVRMMQFENLTLISTFILVIRGFVHISSWLFIPERGLRRLFPSIHRSRVMVVILCCLRLDHFKFYFIVAHCSSLPGRLSRRLNSFLNSAGNLLYDLARIFGVCLLLLLLSLATFNRCPAIVMIHGILAILTFIRISLNNSTVLLLDRLCLIVFLRLVFQVLLVFLRVLRDRLTLDVLNT